MLTIIRPLAIVAAFAIAGQASATVYTWVDETGQVHYSDQSVPGCEEMEPLESPTVIRPVGAPRARAAEQPAESADVQAAETARESIYRRLEIVLPAEDECLRRTGNIVKVLVGIDPAPRNDKLLQDPGHRVRVRLDGAPLESEILVGVQDGSLALFLTEVFRGTHQLQIVIEDQDGKNLAQSEQVNFHVQQYSPIIREQQIREQGPVPLPPIAP